MDHKKKWKRHAIIAVALVGLGINFVAEAAIIKGRTAEFYDLASLTHMAWWFWVGLFGLVAINAGISFMGDAVKHRVFYELESKKDGASKEKS